MAQAPAMSARAFHEKALTAPGLNFNSPPISERWYKKLA